MNLGQCGNCGRPNPSSLNNAHSSCGVMSPANSSHRLLNNAAANLGQFVVEHAYSYLKHQRLELLMKYECSDVIIIPRNIFQIMDDPKYVELSSVVKATHAASSTSRLGTSSALR